MVHRLQGEDTERSKTSIRNIREEQGEGEGEGEGGPKRNKYICRDCPDTVVPHARNLCRRKHPVETSEATSTQNNTEIQKEVEEERKEEKEVGDEDKEGKEEEEEGKEGEEEDKEEEQEEDVEEEEKKDQNEDTSMVDEEKNDIQKSQSSPHIKYIA